MSVVFAIAMALVSVDADAARRLGGGGSVGKQSSNVAQREAGQAPGGAAAQKAPAQQQAAATPAQAQPQAPKRGFFGGMLGGLAAGLGLAWLAHALGFGEGLAQVLLVALLVVAVLAVIGFMRGRRGAAAQAAASPYAFQSASPVPEAAALPQYNPDKIGNDASARPWERSSMAFEASKYAGAAAAPGIRIGSALEGAQGWGIPAGFDTEGFLAAAKRNFVTLQDAWDKADMNALRAMMTDEMVREIGKQIAERGAPGAQAGRTEVVMLEARLLGIEDLGDAYMASVEFSGMIREDPSAGPSPFREAWNMTKPQSGATGWLVAGVQALQ